MRPALLSEEHTPSNRRLLVAIVLATCIIGLTMSSAARRGMDHAVAVGPGDQTAIAISLSDSVYRLKLGYVGLRSLFNTMYSYWNGDAGWADLDKLTANFHDAELLNAGIRAATSLGPQPRGYMSDAGLITTYYDDMGEVDYVTLAFLIFGANIQSLFYFYFTVLALSALMFILTFRDRVFALCLLLTTLFAYYIELHLHFFDSVGIPSYWGMRHNSTLCLTPMLHLALLLVWKPKLTPGVGAGAIVQLAILILAWRIRGSVAWVFVFLSLLALGVAVRELWPQSTMASRPNSLTSALASLGRSVFFLVGSWPMLLRRSLSWPVLLVLLGLLGNDLYNRATLHPVYSTDDVMTYHGIWHSASIGLGLYAPDVLPPRVLNVIKSEHLSDGTSAWIDRDYLDRIHFIPWDGRPSYDPPAPGWLSPWPLIGHKVAWHERILRAAYFDRLKAHPARMFWFYAAMPKEVMIQLATPFTKAPTLNWLWLLVAAGVGVCAVLLALARSAELTDGITVLVVGAGALAAATLPYMVSYASYYAMADGILLMVGCMGTAMGVAAYAVIARIQRRAAA